MTIHLEYLNYVNFDQDVINVVSAYMDEFNKTSENIMKIMHEEPVDWPIQANMTNGQPTVSISSGSFIFRIQQKKDHFVINFPNYRNWKKYIPMDQYEKQHFVIKGNKFKNGYYHSFGFKKEQLIEFFNKYVMGNIPEGVKNVGSQTT